MTGGLPPTSSAEPKTDRAATRGNSTNKKIVVGSYTLDGAAHIDAVWACKPTAVQNSIFDTSEGDAVQNIVRTVERCKLGPTRSSDTSCIRVVDRRGTSTTIRIAHGVAGNRYPGYVTI